MAIRAQHSRSARKTGVKGVMLAIALSLAASSACVMPQREQKAPSATATLGPPSVATRFARLTHAQWQNTIQDLFGLDVPAGELAREFRLDPNQSGFLFDNYVASLTVDEALWREYQRAAADIAERVSSDPDLLAALAPAGDGDTQARARTLITSLGPKMHRRPLTAQEVEQYLALFSEGHGLYPKLDEFSAGTRLLLEALLQSPLFLYRIEGHGGGRHGKVLLDGYDIASRLSYTLWNTMPDVELFDAAASGKLTEPDVIAAQAQRLLEDPRAQAVVSRFHAQLFERDRLHQVTPSRDRYPEVSEHFTEYAAKEADLFFRYEVFERNGSYKDLLTSSETFVNEELAAIYGMEGYFEEEFGKVELDPDQRQGFLTQIAFLASHATSVDPDPIHRGVFIARRLLCDSISAPPGTIPPLPTSNGRTNRETVAAHTEVEGSVCATCHKYVINPLGFPFESYDAVGRYRDNDNGHAVDSTSTALLDKKNIPVQNAVELAQALANSPQAHACYARHWLEYAYGRPSTRRDQTLIQRLGNASAVGELSVKNLLIELLKAPEFSAIDEVDLQ